MMELARHGFCISLFQLFNRFWISKFRFILIWPHHLNDYCFFFHFFRNQQFNHQNFDHFDPFKDWNLYYKIYQT